MLRIIVIILSIIFLVVTYEYDLTAIVDFLFNVEPLHSNLKLMYSVITDHIILFVIGFVSLFLKINRAKVYLNKISILGLTIEVKETDKEIKNKVKQFLDSKRTLFFFDKEKDNIDDVLQSYYEIYKFLRECMGNFEKFDNADDNQCYVKLKEMIICLNEFLTNYQSDYRHWYKVNVDSEYNGITIHEFQKKYFKYDEICNAFEELNTKMKRYGEFFNTGICWREKENEA